MANSDFYFFQNCRGLNYYPIREDLYLSSMVQTFPYGAYQGVWGGYTNWKWFDYQSVDRQLSWLKRIGINCLRLHLSYYAWMNEVTGAGLPFLAHLQQFASLCNKYNIFACYTLWDGFNPQNQSSNATTFPQLNTDYTTTAWTEPGYYQVSDKPAADAFYAISGPAYISAVVSAVSGFQSTLLYDVMNEPDFQNADDPYPPYLSSVSGMAVSSAEWIKQINPLCHAGAIPRQYTMVGTARIYPTTWVENSTQNLSHSIADSSAIDVVSIHPYTILPVTKAHWMAVSLSAAQDLGKPFFMTEGGSPGNYDMFYDEVKASSPFSSIGMVLWNATVGEPLSRDAFKYTNGLFHGDGTCRLLEEVSGLADWARRSGEYLPWQIDTNFQVKEASEDSFGLDKGYSNYLSSLSFSLSVANVTGVQTKAVNYSPLVNIVGADTEYWFETGEDLLDQRTLLTYYNTIQSLPSLSSVAETSKNVAIREYYLRRKRINTFYSDFTFIMDITTGLSGTPIQRNYITATTQMQIYDAFLNNKVGGSPGHLSDYGHDPTPSEWEALDQAQKILAEKLLLGLDELEDNHLGVESPGLYTFPII